MGKITRKELNDELNNELDSYSTKNELQTLEQAVNEHLDKIDDDLESRGVNILKLGVTGDGVTDDTLAIQYVIDNYRNIIIPPPPVRYRITDEIIFRDGRKIYFIGGNHWNPTSGRDVWFQYDGEYALDKAMFRLSKSPCGVEPSSATTDVKFFGGCVLDGNNKIGYGLYSAYVTNGSSIENVTVIKTETDAIRIEKSWYASYRNLTARGNEGNGITIGKSDWGGVNGTLIENLRAHSCGLRGDFTEENPQQSYGVGFYAGAGTTAYNIVSESNYGAGVVFGLGTRAVTKMDTIYLERNGIGAKTDGKTNRNWGLIVVGQPNGRASKVESLYMKGSVGESDAQSILLTGVEPSGVFQLSNVAYGHYLKAEWGNYQLSDSVHYGISQYIEGHLPTAVLQSFHRNLTTLYVRENGNDNNDGRSISTSFKTLSKAIKKASEISKITTINVDGNLDVEVLDFSDINRPLTIEGNNTCTIKNVTSNAKLEFVNASQLIELKNFSEISRFEARNCNNIRISNSNFVLNDNGAVPCFRLINSNVFLDTSNIDGVRNTNIDRKGVNLYNSTLKLKDTTITNFPTGGHLRIFEGSSVIDKTYQSFYSNITWNDGTGYVIAGNKIINPNGSLTLS